MISRDVDKISVCMVTEDYSGSQLWLSRVADIENGCLVKPYYDENEPKYFSNRDRLFYRDGPDTIGFVGVWHWTAVPNVSGTGSDYITTEYISNVIPIEIIELSGIGSTAEIISELKNGIEEKVLPIRFFVCTLVPGKGYSGVLCKKQDFEIKNGKYVLKSTVATLGEYEFPTSSIYRFGDKKLYKDMRVGNPIGIIFAKNPNEIIKDIILKRASWSTMKARGMSRAHWNEFKSFVSDIGNSSLFEEIENKFGCTQDEAEKYLDSFIKSAEAASLEDDIDEKALEAIVLNSEALMKKCNHFAEENWKTKNAEKIAEAETEFQEILNAIEEEKKNLQTAKEEFAEVYDSIIQAKEELNIIQKNIEKQEQIGVQVSTKVQEKIAAAKENVVDFIAEILFIQGKEETVNHPENDVVNSSEFMEKKEWVRSGISLNQGTPDINELWSDTVSTISSELYEAGVESNYCHKVAAFLYAAYTNHFPLLLAGPCGEAIANALSAAIDGKTATVLDCTGEFSGDAVHQLLQLNEEVIVIKNPLQRNWIESLCEILAERSKFYVITHPYAEDLLIEPQGIFNYMQPVLTELFVDKVPSGKYVGGVRAEEYVNYLPIDNPKKKHAATMQKLKMRKIVASKVTQLLADYHEILKCDDINGDYMFALMPYAYCTGNSEVIAEILKEEKRVNKSSISLMLDYMGIDE